MDDVNLLKACAGLPEGTSDRDYSPMTAVNEKLVGKRIVSVEALTYNIIKLVFDNGLYATITHSRIAEYDLDILITA